tara:strand:+ start:57 stop:284 length:228 start_codon:yes stop_codon:yes gene_type:complete
MKLSNHRRHGDIEMKIETWQEIQVAWQALTHDEKVVVADKFDKELKQHWPETHAKLLVMFKDKVGTTILNALGDK